MAWVQIQKASMATWEMYESVQQALGDEPAAGLIAHAAGETANGTWQSVSIWESREAFDQFRDERLMPAVAATLGDELVAAGPPPEEWFEARHLIAP